MSIHAPFVASGASGRVSSASGASPSQPHHQHMPSGGSPLVGTSPVMESMESRCGVVWKVWNTMGEYQTAAPPAHAVRRQPACRHVARASTGLEALPDRHMALNPSFNHTQSFNWFGSSAVPVKAGPLPVDLESGSESLTHLHTRRAPHLCSFLSRRATSYSSVVELASSNSNAAGQATAAADQGADGSNAS